MHMPHKRKPHLAVNAGVDALKHTRHTNEHGRLEDGNVLDQLQDVTLE